MEITHSEKMKNIENIMKNGPGQLPGIPGMPLPPLPDGSMPLPPLPNPNASDALAALKMQMDEDWDNGW